MDISTTEYEQQRTVFQLCEWINQKLKEFEQTPEFDEDYFERRGRNVKQLLEEAIPTARLGLYFWRPWREVNVTCLVGSHPYDATIHVQDVTQQETIHVEVTTIETEQSAMERQKLAREGFVSPGVKAWREGRMIRQAEPEMVDFDEESTRIVNHIFERFRIKAQREDDAQTAILVYVHNTFPPLSTPYRHELIQKTRGYLIDHQPTLYGVYYCYDPELGIDGLRNKKIRLM